MATWTLDTQSGDLRGNTKINVHYYEDGNVQLNANKEHEAKINVSEVKKKDDGDYHILLSQYTDGDCNRTSSN